MAGNFYGAIVSFSTCFLVTIAISLRTAPRPEGELKGLVYSLTPRPRSEGSFLLRPTTVAVLLLALTIALNIRFW
jgi:SSS family solute:Na+ symporter